MNEPTHRPPAVRELADAIRLTREYIGEDLLPPVEGWSWYDALRRWAPEYLPQETMAEPEPDSPEEVQLPGPEAPPEQTEEEQLRDRLWTAEYALQRIREALGTESPTPDADGLSDVIARVRAAARIEDDQDVTDWQRGYRACSERVLAALDGVGAA